MKGGDRAMHSGQKSDLHEPKALLKSTFLAGRDQKVGKRFFLSFFFLSLK
jgi:hypothetical protein